MTVEDRLRDALRAEADGVGARDDSWSTIEAAAGRVRRARLVRRSGLSIVAIAAAVAVVLGVVQVLDHGHTRKQSLQVTNQPPPTPVDEGPQPVWDRAFIKDVAAAMAFAKDYLQMPSPSVSAPDGSGVFQVRPHAGRGPVTTVRTAQQDRGWVVMSAFSDNLRLQSPKPNDAINPIVTLSGESTAFEGAAQAAVRAPDGRRLGGTTFTGGGNGDLAPFHAVVAYPYATNVTNGAVELFTLSAEDGSIVEATVVAVKFGPGPLTDPPKQPQPQPPSEVTLLRKDGHVVRYRDGAVVTDTPMTTATLHPVRVDAFANDAWVERADVTGCHRQIVSVADRNHPIDGGSPTGDQNGVAFTRSSTGDTCHHDSIVWRNVISGEERTWTGWPGAEIVDLKWSPSQYLALIVQTGDGREVRLLDTQVQSASLFDTSVVVPDGAPPNPVPTAVGFWNNQLAVLYKDYGLVIDGGVTNSDPPILHFDIRWDYLAWVDALGFGESRIAGGCCAGAKQADVVDVSW